MLYQVTVTGDATKVPGFGEVAYENGKSTVIVRMDSAEAAKMYVKVVTGLPVVGCRQVKESRRR